MIVSSEQLFFKGYCILGDARDAEQGELGWEGEVSWGLQSSLMPGLWEARAAIMTACGPADLGAG